ncbi:MAG: 4-(cytidine 5'-diphospho)-2-C-methyl-D-erythritol kinase [Chloroflexota bacterium]
MLTLRAPAKINLSLEVLGKRDDGFHELVSVVQSISLFDILSIEPAATISFQCTEPSLTENNIVEKAAVLTQQYFGIKDGALLHLKKVIPAAAGLGGGSSDAAATLLGLVRLWDLRATPEQLLQLASDLGSDVPYFLHGGTALVEGRGERVTKINNSRITWYVLVNPGFAVPTRTVFEELLPDEWTSGQPTRDMAEHFHDSRRGPNGFNGLQNALFRLYPEAMECFQKVDRIAPCGAFVSGSGPTVVASFTNKDDAITAQHAWSSMSYWTCVAATLATGGAVHTCDH